MKKIALLFLTRSELNHASFWQSQITSQSHHFNVYIHSKEPLQDIFFSKYRIPNIVPTSYFIHVKAWQALLEEALKDPENQKFVFLSESCIPLYPLELIYRHLLQDDNSYMNYGRSSWEIDDPREVIEVPKEHRWTNSEWIILNRHHAQMIVDDREIIDIVSKYIHDQEAYASILFSLKKCLDEFVFRKVTFAIPSILDFPHPLIFNDYDDPCVAFIIKAKEEKALFARKFSRDFPDNALMHISQQRLNILPEWIADSDQQYFEGLFALEEMNLANRCELLTLLLQQLDLKLGYEVGAYCGMHLKALSQANPSVQIYGVDSYIDRHSLSMPLEKWDILYQIVETLLLPFKPQVKLIRKSSLEASENIKDGSLDFVFINQQHFQESLAELLNIWYPKVRKGGVLAGYDVEGESDMSNEVANFFNSKGIAIHRAPHFETHFWAALD